MATVTIVVNDRGELLGVIVPEGITTNLVLSEKLHPALRYGGGHEMVATYDPERDDGQRVEIAGYFRSRDGCTTYRADELIDLARTRGEGQPTPKLPGRGGSQ